jgi:tripartite-type tricarboxylate transporter receptor subunit TctC
MLSAGTWRVGLACLVVSTALNGRPADAQTVEEFYRGKTIMLQIGTTAGGGYDVYARLLARHLGKYIPGNPRIAAQNIPGAGSLKLANDLYNTAPRDGSVIGAIGKEQVTSPLFGVAGVRFDSLKFNWLGTLDRTTSVCASWHTSPFKSLEQTRTKQMVFGGTGPASMTFVLPTAMREVLGFNLKVVGGYPGGNEVALAMERGEIDGRCGWSWASLVTTHKDWITNGRLNFLGAASRSRIPELPDVPSVVEFAKTDEQRQVLNVILGAEAMARPFLLPPEVPADRVAALRNAFASTMVDKELVAQAQKIGLEFDPADWQEMTDNIHKLYATPPAVVDIVNGLIKYGKL